MNNFDLNLNKFFFKLSSKLKIRIYKKIIRFLSTNIGLTDALNMIYNNASYDGKKPKKLQAVVIDQWRKSINNGLTLSQAIKGWVPESDRLVIEGGEKAGNIPNALEKAILISESSGKIAKTVIFGLMYPLFFITIVISFLILFSIYIIPEFATIVPEEKWIGLGHQIYVVSYFIKNWLTLSLIGVAAFIFICFFSLSRWTGNIRKFFDHIPPWSIYKLIQGTSFLITTSAMSRSGIAIPNIIRNLLKNATPWYKERLSKILFHINNGYNLGEALYKAEFDFPEKEIIQDLRSYAKLNKFEDGMEEMAKEWLQESVDKIQTKMNVFKNMALFMMFITILWLYGSIYSIITLIQQMANSQ